MSKDNKKRKKHHKKHRVVLPYITTPIVYLLISLIIVVPAAFIGMNIAVNAVHKAQQVLTVDYNDIDISTDTDGNLTACDYIGNIECPQLGLKSDIYYGINRVSLRNGCGMEYDENGALNIVGYSAAAFKPLLNVKIDNVFTLTTKDGEKMYRVSEIANKPVKNTDESTLVLCTTKSNEAFSYYAKDKLYVVAKEVLYE